MGTHLGVAARACVLARSNCSSRSHRTVASIPTSAALERRHRASLPWSERRAGRVRPPLWVAGAHKYGVCLVWLPKMRFLWPAATLFLLLIVVALIYFYRDRVIGCDVMEPGGTLYLTDEAVDTVRGRFCYASDCRLIAELMSEVERASWYCY